MIQRMKRVGIRCAQLATGRGAWAGFVGSCLGIFGGTAISTLFQECNGSVEPQGFGFFEWRRIVVCAGLRIQVRFMRNRAATSP